MAASGPYQAPTPGTKAKKEQGKGEVQKYTKGQKTASYKKAGSLQLGWQQHSVEPHRAQVEEEQHITRERRGE